MKRSLSTLLTAALITIVALRISSGAEPARQSILGYHADPGRSGNFIVRSLTWDRASSLQLDSNFRPRISGHVYAQPLYWRGSDSSSGTLLVATEDNVVHALDAMSGQEIWQRTLGKPVPRSSLPCGNISPLGVTGTPVIDASTEAIYLNAAVEGASGPRHLVFALSLKDGTPLPGWPIDVMKALAREGQTFVARDQNQRGAPAAPRVILNPYRADRSELGPLDTRALRAGDIIRFERGGGAGYGDPHTRDPEAIRADIRNGYVSARAAKKIYGFAADAEAELSEV